MSAKVLEEVVEAVAEQYKIIHKMAQKINDLAEVSNTYAAALGIVHNKLEEIFSAHNNLNDKAEDAIKRIEKLEK